MAFLNGGGSNGDAKFLDMQRGPHNDHDGMLNGAGAANGGAPAFAAGRPPAKRSGCSLGTALGSLGLLLGVVSLILSIYAASVARKVCAFSGWLAAWPGAAVLVVLLLLLHAPLTLHAPLGAPASCASLAPRRLDAALPLHAPPCMRSDCQEPAQHLAQTTAHPPPQRTQNAGGGAVLTSAPRGGPAGAVPTRLGAYGGYYAPLQAMKYPRSDFRAIPVGSSIFLIGGITNARAAAGAPGAKGSATGADAASKGVVIANVVR